MAHMITAEPYEFEGEHFVTLTSDLGAVMHVSAAEYAQLSTVGYLVRDYDHAISLLAQARRDQKLSLVAVGERMGHSFQQVGQWLRGTHQAQARNLLALADALGYDVALVPRAGHPSNPDGDSARLVKPQGAEPTVSRVLPTPEQSRPAEGLTAQDWREERT
jgi:transcriptional regulator with XRE-family HTH domain